MPLKLVLLRERKPQGNRITLWMFDSIENDTDMKGNDSLHQIANNSMVLRHSQKP